MISYLHGHILIKEDRSIIVNTGAIGYQVFVPNQIMSETNVDDEISLFVHTHVREDQITLYGFKTYDELRLFKLLLTVSGIGPKIALEIISSPSSLIVNAIASEDTVTLSKIPGLGKKTAERLILELKNKIGAFVTIGEHQTSSIRQNHEEAISALNSLGYSRYQIIKSFENMSKEITTTEEIVRYFLKTI